MFHSALVFISFAGSTFSICTASIICLSMASFLNVPVTFIWNSCSSPLWTSLQWRHNGEFVTFRALRSVLCLSPLVYALPPDSPLYSFLSSHSPLHVISYVMLSELQFPVPPEEQTKHCNLPHPCGLNGFFPSFPRPLCVIHFSRSPVGTGF